MREENITRKQKKDVSAEDMKIVSDIKKRIDRGLKKVEKELWDMGISPDNADLSVDFHLSQSERNDVSIVVVQKFAEKLYDRMMGAILGNMLVKNSKICSEDMIEKIRHSHRVKWNFLNAALCEEGCEKIYSDEECETVLCKK